MQPKPILYVIVAVLAIGALAAPLLLRQMPFPLRLLVSFGNLIAAFAVALVIRQARHTNRLNSLAERAKAKHATRE